ncbi:recombinase family protein [Streptomyces sp. NRRL F-2664]|uniref:recombinase family protein n=1 Tax=Streptomyces sp. NRRL F-2664 TaxID=1463842 RepID=UPI003B639E61
MWKALDYLREGDTLVVPSLDRLGRSIQDLIAIVSSLTQAGNRLHPAAPGAGHHHAWRRLVFHDFVALAEFIRELIAQGAPAAFASGDRRP